MNTPFLNSKRTYESPYTHCLTIQLSYVVCASGFYDNSVTEDVTVEDEYQW